MILESVGKILSLFQRINDKAIGLYQLSKIKHGIGCEIRGGALVVFKET